MPPKKRPNEVLPAPRGRPPKVTTHTDEEQSDANTSATLSSIPSRGRPPKRAKKEADALAISAAEAAAAAASAGGEYQSFIMKLFDRSLDLAKYPSNSALYPLCRAWMVNQPRSNKLINFKRRVVPPPEKRPAYQNMMEDLRTGKLTDIKVMPAYKRTAAMLDRIPDPMPTDDHSDVLDINYDLDAPTISRDALLDALKTRSVAVRKSWQSQTREYQEEMYGKSFQMLDYIYKQ